LVYDSTCTSCNVPSGVATLTAPTSEYVKCYDIILCPDSAGVCGNVNGATSTCTFTDSYGGGDTVQGAVISGSFTYGGLTTSHTTYGTITQYSPPSGNPSASFENSPASGIWGLGPVTLSKWGYPGALDWLIKDNSLPNVFSLHLSNNEMTIGQDFSANASLFTWVKTTNGDRQYVIPGYSVFAGSSTMSSNKILYLIDSGTTLLLLDPVTYSNFLNYLQSGCIGLDLPYVGFCGVVPGQMSTQNIFNGQMVSMTTAQVDVYPNLSFALGDYLFTLESSQWLYSYGNGAQTKWTSGVSSVPSGGTTEDNPAILGDVFMQNYHVVFDRQNTRIGFSGIYPPSNISSNAVILLFGQLILIFSLLLL